MTTIQDLFAAVDGAALPHFGWCRDHDYSEPDIEICKARIPLEFPPFGTPGDDVDSLSIELSGSDIDVRHGFDVPRAVIGYNGGSTGHEMDAWKLRPFALALLAADAHVRGDVDEARAFMDAANLAITEHLAGHGDDEPEYTVAQPLDAAFNTPKYVQGMDPEDGVITYDEYLVRKAVDAGIPQWVVQHTASGKFHVVGAQDDKPVDGVEYDEFDDAKAVRDRLNGQARHAATLALDVEVVVVTGRAAGHEGVIDEIDDADPEQPYRVRFEHEDGEPVAWFGPADLMIAGGAR